MPHSKDSTDLFLMGTYTVFLSANHSSYTDKEAHAAHQRMVSDITLQGHYYKLIEGVYNGKREQSYMVRCDNVMDLLNLQALGHKYHQECIMIVDTNASHILLNYSDDTTQMIGCQLICVTEKTAKTYDSYSIIDGAYWVVIG